MLKKIFLINFLISFSCFAQSTFITQIQGSFRPTSSLNKVVFVNPLNKNYTTQEYNLINNWLTQRFKNSGYNYNNLTIYLNSNTELGKNVKGCFNSWYKTLQPNDRLTLTEHFKPNGLYVLSKQEIDNLSNGLLNYTIDNLQTCKDDNVLGDITTAFITIGLDQYITDKLNNFAPNTRYNDILEKLFDQQSKKIGWHEVSKLSSWLEATQINFPLLSAEVLEKYFSLVKELKDKTISESEAAFILIEAMNLDPNLLKEILTDHNKILPYVQAASLLYVKCFIQGKFIAERCDIKNIGNNFIIINQMRRNKTLSHLIWVGV